MRTGQRIEVVTVIANDPPASAFPHYCKIGAQLLKNNTHLYWDGAMYHALFDNEVRTVGTFIVKELK